MLGRLINGHQQTDPKRRVKAQEHRHDVCAYRKPRPGSLRLPQSTCNMLHSLFCILLISNVLLSFGEAQCSPALGLFGSGKPSASKSTSISFRTAEPCTSSKKPSVVIS